MKKIFTKNQFAAVLFLALPFLGKSQQTPYLKDTLNSGVTFKTIISANEAAQNGYKMAGIPDGLGAFDNGNGTFTVLMNHEINGLGVKRAHGSKGAFVSKWIIKKSDLTVVSGSDLMQNAKLWNGTSYTSYTSANNNDQTIARFSRFCSADLPEVAAFYNSNTGKGTQERIFMNGEESGAEGRAVAHIVTGSEASVSYELPYLGKYSWESAVALPYKSDKTVVAGMDDGTGGQVYFYIGTKTNTGTDIQKAGLTNGKVYGIKITGVATEAATGSLNVSPNTTFTLVDLGDVSAMTGAQLEAASIAKGVTTFQRPEDGTWNPNDLTEFYFATTNAFANPSRLWKLKFSDINNPENGGTITAVLDGTEGQKMLDNICFDNNGNMILLEDVGNNAHNGKIWQYTPATDVLKMIGKHDAARFGEIGIAATAPFSQDEETSGVIDVSCILGNGWFLIVDQAHYTTGMPSDIVEGGQFLAMYNPASVFSAPSGSNNVCAGSTISLSHNALNGVWSTAYTSQASVNANTGLLNARYQGNIEVKYTVTNSTGCTLSSTKTVTINPIPAVPSITFAAGTVNPQAGAPTGGFCVGKTFTVVGTPNSLASTWSANGSINVTSAGLATINATGTGSLKYTYTNANGCSNSRTMIGTGYTCASRGTSVNENLLSSDKNFVIYPNPAKTNFSLVVDKVVGKGQIIVTNLFGKEVKSQNLSMGVNTIDINNLAKGFYLVNVVTSEGKSTQKLIVE